MSSWELVAACRTEKPEPPHEAEWVNLFFPEHGKPIPTEAKAVCARCPVTLQCLESAVNAGHQRTGCFGGVGSRKHKQLRLLKPQCLHDYRPGCDGPYCSGVRALLADPDAELDRQLLLDNRSHGSRSTYAAGCRCPSCSLAQSLYSYTREAAA